MRWPLLMIATYLAAVAQTTSGPALAVGATTPDWMVLAAMLWLLTGVRQADLLCVALVGLLGDAVEPGRFGCGAVGVLALSLVLARWRERVWTDNIAWQTAVTGIAATTVSLSVFVGQRFFGPSTFFQPRGMAYAAHAASVGLYTAIVSAPVWLVVRWLREPQRRRAAA